MTILFIFSSLLAGIVLQQPIVDELIAGAVPGLFVGMAVGATIWPIMQVPESLGRALLFGILGALGMAIFRFVVYIAPITGGSLTSLQDALIRSSAAEAALIDTGVWVLATLFIGMAIGAITYTAGDAVKGAIVGLFLGAVVSAGLQVLLAQLGYGSFIEDSRITYYMCVGLLTWGVLIGFK